MSEPLANTLEAHPLALLFDELIIYVYQHRLHMLLLLPGSILFTIIHEAAHAVMVWFQGGKIIQFIWMPTYARNEFAQWEWLWGYISYEFLEDQVYSDFLIASAPYILMLGLMLFAAITSLRRKPYAFWLASTLFIWLYVVPNMEIMNELLPWLLGYRGDFWSAFGEAGQFAWIMTVVWLLLVSIIGFWVQQALYRQQALSPLTYSIFFSTGLLLFFLLLV